MTEHKTALVLGATGGVGGMIAKTLSANGWRVRGMVRDPAKGKDKQIEWVQGDALVANDVLRAARGMEVIVHAVNPPGYRNWDKVVLPMIDNTIAAAREHGARIVLPGTVYNYDPAKAPVVSETTPQRGTSRKGRIRIALEKRLKDAAPEVETLIVRAGDYFGPGARSSWFSQAMIAPGKPISKITAIARSHGHSWAYLPDLAQAVLELLNKRAELKPFECVQFEGFYDATGQMMYDALDRVAGRKLKIARFPWWAMHMLAPFGGFPREVSEIAPVWSHPMRLDNARLVALLGAEPRTDPDIAIRNALAAIDALPHSAPGKAMLTA